VSGFPIEKKLRDSRRIDRRQVKPGEEMKKQKPAKETKV
jgi:hypothetical protein